MQEKFNALIRNGIVLVLLISVIIVIVFSFRGLVIPLQPSISILESGVETENLRETIHINNCGGTVVSRQIISRSS